jgi:hypothetical protein
MKLYADYDASKDEVVSVCMKSSYDPSKLGMFEVMTNRTIKKPEFLQLKETESLPPVTTGILDGERWFYMELPEVVENQKYGKPE